MLARDTEQFFIGRPMVAPTKTIVWIHGVLIRFYKKRTQLYRESGREDAIDKALETNVIICKTVAAMLEKILREYDRLIVDTSTKPNVNDYNVL